MKNLILIYYRNYRKRLPQFLILTSLLLFIVSIIIVFNFSNRIYQNEIINDLANRKLVVINDDIENSINVLSKIKSVGNVLDVYIDYPPILLVGENKESFEFIYRSPSEIKVLSGKSISEILENEIIISEKLMQNKNINEILKINSSSNKYVFHIAGVYSAENNKTNHIYVSEIGINYMLSQEEIELPKKTFIVIVDDYKNVGKVSNMLEELGFVVNFVDSSGIQKISTYKSIISMLELAILLLIAIVFFLVFVIIKNMITTENKDIFIMKVSGFRKKQIINIIFIRLVILISIVSVLVLILYNVLYFVIFIMREKGNFFELLMESYLLNLKDIGIVILLLWIITYILSRTVYNKLNKVNLISLFRD